MEGSITAGHGAMSMFHQALQKEKIIDFGEIHSISFPPQWMEMPVKSFGNRVVRKFAAMDFPEVRVCSVFRKEDLDSVTATNFHRILYSDFHDLEEEEICELEDLLESVANKALFDIEVARTGFLNHRRILKVSGSWLKTNEKMIGGFIDINGSANYTQQLYFAAPNFHYAAFEADALESLMSVVWKESKF